MDLFNKFTIVENIIFNNILRSAPIMLISEGGGWVIQNEAKQINRFMKMNGYPKTIISNTPYFIKNKITHFLSINTICNANRIRKVNLNNKIIITWYHMLENDSRVKWIPQLKKITQLIHTSCSITQKRLIENGFTKDQVIIIPIPIDINNFSPTNLNNKMYSREKYRLPIDKIIIGSFQKDGEGWASGNNPKLIKGPDILCDTIEILSRYYPIHVLLSGPSRGYVKNRLSNSGITFSHFYLDKPSDLCELYHAIDLYLITSRIEGGPKSLLECMACKTPFVTTKVGMAIDILNSSTSGIIADNFSPKIIAEYAIHLLEDNQFCQSLTEKAYKIVQKYDWKIIINDYYTKLYSPLET